ncbi:hypothetical protein HPP92_026792 [Vanilla planifolia]|uniref:Uncharacterized protein n=1 Tax=Vanilla planifolia TaxID=51239 RepID=A0A835PCU8_VANPL|nr:hypothetical protein HPP92_026792 [Vanilla planifolia]
MPKEWRQPENSRQKHRDPNKQRCDASKTQDTPDRPARRTSFQQHFPMAAQAMQAPHRSAVPPRSSPLSRIPSVTIFATSVAPSHCGESRRSRSCRPGLGLFFGGKQKQKSGLGS